ncbi:MAG: hypothetical protein WA919_12800 [Coleofasciculaceae cyanobacterium]
MTPTYSEEVVNTAKTNLEEPMQQQSMQDILLLLEKLLEREETTVKIILDCLYDVGSVNLINKKFRSRSLKGIMRSIAIMSKPVFKIFALRWLKKNCPRLITQWLRRQVTF